MKRRLPMILVLLLAAPIIAQEAALTSQPIHFRAVDVLVDSKGKPLAAYQLEVSARKGTVKIVGIEGGEHPVFKDPPFYDPKAMQHERVIIAAFSTARAERLPRGRTRVATIHVQVTGEEQPQYSVKCQAAASVEGEKIPVTASIEERRAK